MTVVGYATLQVVPSLRGAQAIIDREMGGVMPAAGARAGENFGGGVTSGFQNRMSALPRIAGIAAKATGAALLGGGIAAATWGIKIAAANEQAQISFGTMLGSAKEAKGFLGELRDFAAKTPFEFPELQTAASSLISAGVEASKVIPIMTTLGDVTAGMGTGSDGIRRATVALQQMQAAGKITGEDLNQLRDAGIPVYDLLAAATGRAKTEVTALATAGKLGKADLDALMQGLESGKGLERFAGLMDKQSQSLTGLFSTLKDTFGQNLAVAMQPVVDLAKDQLPAVTRAGEKVTGWFADGLDAAIDFGREVAPLARNLGRELVPILQDLADIAVAPALKAGAEGVKGLLTVSTVAASAIGELTGFLADHKTMVYAVAGAWAGYQLGLKAAAGWQAATAAVTGLTTSFTYLQGAIASIAATQGVSTATASLGVLRSSLTTTASAGATGAAVFAGAVVGWKLATDSLARSADHGREAAERFVKGINIDPKNTESMRVGLVGINTEMERLGKEAGRSAWVKFGQRINPFADNKADEAVAAMKLLEEESKRYSTGLTRIYKASSLLGTSSSVVSRWAETLDLDPATIKSTELAYAIGKARAAAKEADPSIGKMADAVGVLADETSNSTDRINAWKDALDAAMGVQKGVFDATTDLRTSLRDLTWALATNGSDIASNTKEADDNRDALSGAVQAAIDLSKAYADTGNIKAANLILADSRNRLLDAGEAAGVSRDQMSKYLDELGLTPETVTTQIRLQGIAEAQAKVADLIAKLSALGGLGQLGAEIVQVGSTFGAGLFGTTADGKPKNAKGGSAPSLTGGGSSNPVGGMLGGTKKSKAVVLPGQAPAPAPSAAARRGGSTVRDVTVISTGATASGVARDLQWELR